jgi:hypothetical protein
VETEQPLRDCVSIHAGSHPDGGNWKGEFVAYSNQVTVLSREEGMGRMREKMASGVHTP